jgi:hypothetical protein
MKNFKLVVIKRSYQEDLIFGIISQNNVENFLKSYVERISESYYFHSIDKKLDEGFAKILAVECIEDLKKRYSQKMCWIIEFKDVVLNDYIDRLNPTDFEGRKLLKKLIY